MEKERRLIQIRIQRLKEKIPVSKDNLKDLLKNGLFLFILFFSILFLITIKTHLVSGNSMLPTLQNKDRLFVVKNKEPKRYALVTFQPREKQGESYVKRVIGIPGDRIWMDQNTVYLNHQMAATNPTPPNEKNLSGVELPDGTLKVRVTWEVAAKLKGMSTIPSNSFFVLGDNRKNSTDSRELGLIDQDKIEGVVTFRYYPLARLGLIE
ncbi:signal peptidase I [Enterococcus rivorum]|uniref:Signal peptidase I n=1 Tax=Enterococcus rivorum TaxID=762845 RepID=A0A1E5KSB4_9ENTE|nr:signal peptidase I [Enterococcus rivorum]OEH80760.1 signal peptidase I [Enterococcus rivorum]